MLAGNDDAFEIVELLLDAGANVNAQDKVSSALHRSSTTLKSSHATRHLGGRHSAPIEAHWPQWHYVIVTRPLLLRHKHTTRR